MILYPLGALVGELGCVYVALPTIEAKGVWSVAMPNSYNFAFYFPYFCRAMFVIWPLGLVRTRLYPSPRWAVCAADPVARRTP